MGPNGLSGTGDPNAGLRRNRASPQAAGQPWKSRMKGTEFVDQLDRHVVDPATPCEAACRRGLERIGATADTVD